MNRRALLPAPAILALLLLGTPAVADASSPPQVVPPNDTVAGLSYSQWSAQWWQWAYETPWKGANGRRNLLVSGNGPVDCSFGQTNKHVWYLGGTYFNSASNGQQAEYVANRPCTVPAGV